MKRLVGYAVLSAALLGASARAMAADAPSGAADADQPGDVIVRGEIDKTLSTASALPLTLKETPQSVTVIDRARISDFALTNVNDLLAQVPGINVERVETDRTYYNSRGFDVTNFQVDGIGLPLISGIQFGDLDTVLFDRVEAVRGANGMMTGVGNPSATINYVRKRPTPTFQASLSGQLGSWDDRRVEADVSGPLNAAGTVQARAIFAHEDRDSYLDYNHVNRNVYGALLSWDVTPKLKATIGYSRQQNDARGVMWGALPLSYSDGTQISAYPVSASTSADWTHWNVRDQTAFGELAYAIGSGWSVKGVFTYRHFQEDAKLLYAYGYPDRETGLGVYGMSGVYPSDYKQYLFDGYASGPVHLFGREHELAFGASTGTSKGREYEGFSDETIEFPDFRSWGRSAIAEPSYPDPILQAQTRDRLTRVYGAVHLNITDRLKGVVGASFASLKSTGTSYGTDQARKNSKVSPYVGALYDLTGNVTVYASYTDIFNPQIEVDSDNRKLAPAMGSSYEAGIKSEWFDKRFYATAAIFQAKQKGLATAAGTFGEDSPNGPVGTTFYTGVDTTAKGFEFELAGRITDTWTLSGGYTYVSLKDEAGAAARPYLPGQTLKLATTYAVPELRDLKLGAQLRWQNGIHYVDSGVQTADGADAVVRQPSYAVVDLMASIAVIERVRATVNVRNVADKKYLASLLWGQAYYAAPRSVSFGLAFNY